MGSTNGEQSPRRGLSVASRMSLCCAASVLAVALLCGLYSYPKWCDQARRQFEERAGAALQFTKTALLQDEDKHPKELLRKFFQLETKRGHFDQLALVVGRRVAISHSLDWEGLELNALLGNPDRSPIFWRRRRVRLASAQTTICTSLRPSSACHMATSTGR